ncbi:NACHT-domain-containing protein [Trichoderma citrinoviride]|uniref:NACHT-domain-containing protein n=1 Tax=Trichoderma citrinoviride TaxID=58853 RepID=A0A2T4BBJ7_9HYPO|nr:NACHT-domain-containing protein [Trichoderma citrinoviride]PTB66713.1 NACHT-domain-containing protein [Trichoderma citrinoviride]
MSSICNYYRNRGFVLLRDIVKLDDWEGKFKSIQKADDVLRKKINTFLGLEAKSHLKDLVDHTKAHERYHRTKEDQQCLRDLRITDPRADRNRIEDTKGGLLQESYQWILENPQFKTWRVSRDSHENRLLWLRGDPGKGKTMLLCGLVKELREQSASCLVTFFFCQATDPTINNHIAVLRGLMWLLADQRPSLISHIRKVYDTAGKSAFDEGNAWYTLSEIFGNMLGDEGLPLVHIVIDALDECTKGMTELLGFIQKTSRLHNVKWVVSSRNWTEIEEKLNQEMSLSLEVNATLVETAVDAYISLKASQIAILRQDDDLKEKVCSQIRKKANGTFLWAAIVIQRLNIKAYYDNESEILGLLDEMPQDLSKLYALMLERTSQLEGKGPELCRAILAIATLAHRPLHLDELSCLVGFKGNLRNLPRMKELVNDCGSFLTVREDIVYFIHQSAKDYLADDLSSRPVIFPSGEERVHYDMVSNSLDAMKLILRENIYGLDHLGILIDDISPPDPNPLRRILYSCTNWVAHLCAVASSQDHFRPQSEVVDNGEVLSFLETHFLHWLEALSLTRNLPSNTRDIKRLSGLLKTAEKDKLQAFVYDASRFMQYHAHIMESVPMQIYVSALLFSPTESLVRTRFGGKLSSWILLNPITERIWSPCLQVIQTEYDVTADSSGTDLLILNDDSRDVEVWDVTSGKRSQILSHAEIVKYAMFLSDSGRILTFSNRLACSWDANSGTKLSESSIYDLNIGWQVASVSSDGRLVADPPLSANGVIVWDTAQGQVQHELRWNSSMPARKLLWLDDMRALAGKERISLPICCAYFRPCFDVESPYILTQFGRIHWNKLLAQADTLQSAHDYSRMTEGYGLNSDGSWVTWNGRNILWLPPGYRRRGRRVISHDCLIMDTYNPESPCIIRFFGPPPFQSLLNSRH